LFYLYRKRRIDVLLSSAKKKYLLVIYELSENGKDVFSKDIASALGIKRPSVAKMIKAMEEDDLFCKEYYGKVLFSEKGVRIASRLYTQYLLLYEFFKKHLMVSHSDARHDAMICLCDLSKTSVERIEELVLKDP
jgi:DtxR family Mn-dependent transcriptional regulator